MAGYVERRASSCIRTALQCRMICLAPCRTVSGHSDSCCLHPPPAIRAKRARNGTAPMSKTWPKWSRNAAETVWRCVAQRSRNGRGSTGQLARHANETDIQLQEQLLTAVQRCYQCDTLQSNCRHSAVTFQSRSHFVAGLSCRCCKDTPLFGNG